MLNKRRKKRCGTRQMNAVSMRNGHIDTRHGQSLTSAKETTGTKSRESATYFKKLLDVQKKAQKKLKKIEKSESERNARDGVSLNAMKSHTSRLEVDLSQICKPRSIKLCRAVAKAKTV